MPKIDGSNVLVTPDGLVCADELAAGSEVLGLVNGKSALIRIEDAVDIGISDTIQIFSSTGDATLGVECQVATLGGLAKAVSLAKHRTDGSIGRVADDMPRLEVLTGHDVPKLFKAQGIARIAGDAYVRLLQTAAVPSTSGTLLRIGSHPEAEVAAAFGETAAKRMQRFAGQAGWDWLSLGSRTSDGADRAVTEAHATALGRLAWKARPEIGVYGLPIEFEYLRRLTTESYRTFGVTASCSWQPLYAPTVAILNTNTQAGQLVPIDSILAASRGRLISLTLSNSDALLCVGGLLIAA